MAGQMEGGQNWGIRYAGSVSLSPNNILNPDKIDTLLKIANSIDKAEKINAYKKIIFKPGPEGKFGLFEIQNMDNPSEKGLFVFAGVGAGVGISFAQAGISQDFTEFRTDQPVTLSNFGGLTRLMNANVQGYSFYTNLVFNNDIKIQGRSFSEYFWYGDHGVNMPGLVVGMGFDLSWDIGGLIQIGGGNADQDNRTGELQTNPQSGAPLVDPGFFTGSVNEACIDPNASTDVHPGPDQDANAGGDGQYGAAICRVPVDPGFFTINTPDPQINTGDHTSTPPGPDLNANPNGDAQGEAQTCPIPVDPSIFNVNRPDVPIDTDNHIDNQPGYNLKDNPDGVGYGGDQFNQPQLDPGSMVPPPNASFDHDTQSAQNFGHHNEPGTGSDGAGSPHHNVPDPGFFSVPQPGTYTDHDLGPCSTPVHGFNPDQAQPGQTNFSIHQGAGNFGFDPGHHNLPDPDAFSHQQQQHSTDHGQCNAPDPGHSNSFPPPNWNK